MDGKKIALVLVLIALAAAAAFVLLSGDAKIEDDPAHAEEVASVEDRDRTEPPSEVREESATAGERKTVESKVVETSDHRLPDRYRRALGGLIGRVVEADGVTPVPDLQVDLYGVRTHDILVDLGSLFTRSEQSVKTLRGGTRTDGEGRFQLEGLFPDGIHFLGIDLRGPRTTMRFVDRMPNPGRTVDLGDVALEPFVSLTGMVVDEDDRPVKGARVRGTNLPALIFQFGAADVRVDTAVAVSRWNEETWQIWDLPAWIDELLETLPIPETRTDAQGRFTLEAVPVGLLSILVDHRGFVTGVKSPVQSGAAGGSREVGRIMLEEGEEITGRVVDQEGVGVAGVEILVGPRAPFGQSMGILNPAGRTDAEGRFRAAGLSDGEHFVAVLPEGAVDWVVKSEIEPGMGEVLVQLPATHDLLIRVQGAEGERIEEPRLLLRRDIEMSDVPVMAPPIPLDDRVRRQEDGSLLVERLGAQTYDLFVTADGHATSRVEIDLSQGPQSVEVTLDAGRDVRIRVIDATSGEPVERATVHAYKEGIWKEYMTIPLASVRTGTDGRAVLSKLADGAGRLRVEHPAYAATELDVELPTEPIEVELREGGDLVGQVHRGGRPVEEPRFLVIETNGDNLPRFATTDLDGRFEVTHLTPGKHRVEVFPRFAQGAPGEIMGSMTEGFREEARRSVVIKEGQIAEIDIDLLGTRTEGPTATLRGRVLMNGVPSTGYTVSMQPQADWSSRKSTRTDGNGRFDFGLVPAGTLWVQVNQAGQNANLHMSGMISRTITLVANEVRDLELNVETGRLTGRVVADLDGKSLSGANVSIVTNGGMIRFDSEQSFSNLSTITDGAGRFEFEQVPAGSYVVSAEVTGYARSSVGPVEVPYNGSPPPVELRALQGVEVKGVVRLPDDETPEYLFLWMEDAQTKAFSNSGEIDRKTGKFKFPNVAPGEYRLHIASSGASFEPIDLKVPREGVKDAVLTPKRASAESKLESSTSEGR